MRKPSSPVSDKVVRRRLADGTVKEYRYPKGGKHPPAPRYAPDSLDALLAAFRRSPELAARAQATRRTYAIYLRELDAIGAVRAADLRRRELLELRDAIAKARGNGAATGFQRVASALFAWAVDRGWLEHNPLARARVLPGGHLLLLCHSLPWRRAILQAARASRQPLDERDREAAADGGDGVRHVPLRPDRGRRAAGSLGVAQVPSAGG